jgi:4-azaleucine resistance transporter AzlC
MRHNTGYIHGMLAALPIAAVGALDGIIFGIVARNSGLHVVEATMMSLLVTSGSAQFFVLPYFSSLNVGIIILMTLLINSRYLFLGAGIAPNFRNRSPLKTYSSLFFLFDENWALTLNHARTRDFSVRFFVGAGIILYATWVIGTASGFFIPQIKMDSKTYGMIIYIIFAAILVNQWKGKSSLYLWIITGIVAILVNSMFGPVWSLVSGTIAGTIMLLIKSRSSELVKC